MEYIDIIISGCIYISFPILLYVIYVAYNKNMNKKENDFYFDMALFCSLYLVLRFSNINNLYLCFNATLILSAIKKRNWTSLLIILIIIVYYIEILNLSPFLIIPEYILYIILYFFLSSKISNKFLINLFMIIKSIFFIFYTYYYNFFMSNIYITILRIIFVIFIFYIITHFSIWLIKISEEIMKYHMNAKELKREKKIRNSIFKITHEIKNPIAVVKGYLDMFDIDNKEHTKEYIPIIKEEIDKVLVLLQDFLSMTKVNVVKDFMDINYLLENVLSSFKYLISNNNIKLIYEFDEDEMFINGDYNRLTQVFINIIKNAIEALENVGDAKIKISEKYDDKFVFVYIENNGPKLNFDEIKRIKEGFYTTKKNGTGLGVSLSNEIIKAHGGELNYINTDFGLKVEIKIPINN